MTTATGDKLSFTYDTLNRLARTTATAANGTAILNTAYSYRTVSGNQSSAQVEFRNVRVGTGGTLLEGKKYSYDARGNITMISQSTGSYYPLIAYAYDSQNQLIKETYYDGEGTGSAHVTDTYEYTYDTAGNIQSEKKNGTVTKTYTYGDSQWHDKLTAVNGRTITYDAIGNPRTYQIGRGNSWSLSWENGRQLASVERSTTSSTLLTEEKYSNAYDLDGIRSKKVSVVSKYSTSSGGGGDIMSEGDSLQGIVLPPINPPGKKLISKTTKTHTYLTQNGKVVRDTLNTTVFQTRTTRKTEIFDFIYDESGRPFALIYTNGTADPVTYYYVLNLQGDVVKLVNASGTAYATYTYDAWGKVLTATGSMASINPLRYRGYYYDTETGFYYLQSRYYDPANHRFINADSYASTDTTDAVSCNMFAYCLNNPVNRIDPTGHDSSTDSNRNGIPDYLEIRWIRQTIKALKQVEKNTAITIRQIKDKVAVDCSVSFPEFISKDKGSNLLADEMYRYAFCKELELSIRAEEKKQSDTGAELAGSMSFDHIYQELTYHLFGFLVLPEGSSYYNSCVVADLNFDEDRWKCKPMYFITVPTY